MQNSKQRNITPLLGEVCDFAVLMSVVFNYQNYECKLLVHHTNEYLQVMMLCWVPFLVCNCFL